MDVVKAPDNSREQRLTHLVEAYQKPLLALCYIDLHNRALAEDAVQETFLNGVQGDAGPPRGEQGTNSGARGTGTRAAP